MVNATCTAGQPSASAVSAGGHCEANDLASSVSDLVAGDDSWIDELIPDGMTLFDLSSLAVDGDDSDLYRLVIRLAAKDLGDERPASDYLSGNMELLRRRAFRSRLLIACDDQQLLAVDARSAEEFVIGEIRFALRRWWGVTP